MKKNSEYEKIPNTFKQLGLNEKALSDLGKLKWVVTQKIHGANFSFVYENQKLLFDKRKAYLDWDDDFFGFQEVVSRIEDNVLPLFFMLVGLASANQEKNLTAFRKLAQTFKRK